MCYYNWRQGWMVAYIGEYREGKEEWSRYAECLNHFFSQSHIEDDKKKDSFPKSYCPQTYKLLKNVAAPAKPGEMDYTQLVQRNSSE